MLHHLMVGTWTPPGAIFTFEFDDESLGLNLVKRTAIPEDEPISWMTFDVSSRQDWADVFGSFSSVPSMQKRIYTAPQ
jgi:carboxy-cis,cis-muconate cyclase